MAQPESIHAARWIGLFSGLGWDMHLFPSSDMGLPNMDMPELKLHNALCPCRKAALPKSVRLKGICLGPGLPGLLVRSVALRIPWFSGPRRLARLIQKLNPDIVHCLGIQSSAYLALDALDLLESHRPLLAVSNWGSDIFLFNRLSSHTERIRKVLESCALYFCECERDLNLALENGFSGRAAPVVPNCGGFDIAVMESLRGRIRTSERRIITIKGYQGWAGRALVALQALRLCKKNLSGYKVFVYSSRIETEIEAELLRLDTGIDIEILPKVSHSDLLELFSESRIYIGLSISDGVSTSFLEALACGAFPIQSYTSCACEWIANGVGGFLVPPEDPSTVAESLRTALADDSLVDNAASDNWAIIAARLDRRSIKAKAISGYEGLMKDFGK